MAMHARIGFLETEGSLCAVDLDFRRLVFESYKVPGFGSNGVSCAGHFEDTEEPQFWPRPYAHLGFAALPQMSHVNELLKLIYDSTKSDPDARIAVNEREKPPAEFRKYQPGKNLLPYSFETTNEGLYVAVLQIQLGDNHSLNGVKDYWGGQIDRKGNEDVYRKTKERCEQIRKYWQRLESLVLDFNVQHGFSDNEPDFTKPEFLPFRSAVIL